MDSVPGTLGPVVSATLSHNGPVSVEASDLETASVLSRFDRDVLLATGRAVHMRPSRVADIEGMRAFYDRLSDRAVYLRFFGLRPAMSDGDLHPSGGQDIGHRVVLVAVDDADIVGIGEYDRIPGRSEAEVAFAVADGHQGEGIGTVLLEDLALIARASGLSRLVAETMAGNHAMLAVFADVGLTKQSWYESGQVHVELDLTGASLLEDEADGRDWTAAVASLVPVLRPRHVVVVGLGRDAGSPGRAVLANLHVGFTGRVSAVDDAAGVIDGAAPLPARVADLDDVPDLAIVAVPALAVVDVIDECGRAGVRAAVVMSAGFAEQGPEGVDRERALLDTARRHGMRIVGPNCLGVVSSAVGLNATSLRRTLRPGSIAIASQSGGIGVVLADAAARRDLGVSAFVSLGNKVDVSGNDVLRYWADDPATSVVLMYMESIGDPRRFARIARAVSKRLPVVALKGGRSEPGRRGARSHTAALAADDAGVDALFEHTGVLRAATLDQLLDVGALLATQPTPAGRRVLLVGNAGGPLIIAADAAAAGGLDVVELSAPLQARLRRLVPDAAATSNPVDLRSTVAPEALRAVLHTIAASGEVDACVVVVVDLGADGDTTPLRLDWSDPVVPAVAVLFGGGAGAGSMPRCSTPERAVDALALAARRGAWLAGAAVDEVTVDVDMLPVRQRARRLASAVAAPGWLGPADALGLLEDVGVPVARWSVAANAAECVRAAQRVGFPCVIKADVSDVVHKADEGAVVVGVGSASAARRTATMFREHFGSRLRRLLVQQQAAAGIELLIGGVRDPAIGPLVVVAAGGAEAEVLRDRNVVLAPLTAGQARRAVERLRMYPLFAASRGRPAVPVEPIVELIQRVGLLMATVPEISEVDLDPVITAPTGCVVVDARIAVAPPPVQPLRTLRPPRPGSRASGLATTSGAS